MKQKYMNNDKAQWKEPKLTTLISEVGGGTNMQNKQAHILQCEVMPYAENVHGGAGP